MKLPVELLTDVTAKNGEQAAEAVTAEVAVIVTEAAVEAVTVPCGWTSMVPLPVRITELSWKIFPAESAGR